MKLLVTILVGYTALWGIRTHSEEEYWAGWKQFLSMENAQQRHNMYMTKAEHDIRFEVFKDNMERIKEHSKKGHSWSMGITQFSDMTKKEFKNYTACGKLKHKPAKSIFTATSNWNKTAVAAVDWVSEGAVTPIKNQGSCGSCWAFSTTGAIEGRYFVAKGKLNSLSEQDLVDCSKQNHGCYGGVMDYGFEYVEKNNGLCKEDDYSYDGKQNWRCRDNGCTKYDPINSYQDVTASTTALEAACMGGPVSVAIEADEYSFQLYTGGVLTSKCGSNLDHGVLLVGYGTDGSDDYWKVKNSWGEDWGESGYIRLCRNCHVNGGNGQCGILSMASYPIV